MFTLTNRLEQNCPHCNEFMPQMSGVRIEGHDDYPLMLCFKCKSWFNMKKEFVQTI
jgi:hypothetical protein